MPFLTQCRVIFFDERARKVLQPDRPQFPVRANRLVRDATALARLVFAPTHRPPVRQKALPRDRAAPRARADADLGWRYMEDSPRLSRIFQPNFREDRLVGIVCAR